MRSASEFRQEPMFRVSFHTVVTLRASDCAPPDTGVSDLQLVALEYLQSIEGADQVCWFAPFCGEVIFICFALCREGGAAEPRRMRWGSPFLLPQCDLRALIYRFPYMQFVFLYRYGHTDFCRSESVMFHIKSEKT